MPDLNDSNNSQIEVAPTDLSQSLFRVVLVTIILFWTYSRYDGHLTQIAKESRSFQFTVIYLGLSIAIFIWTYYFIQQRSPQSLIVRITRVVSVFTDIGAVSIYTAISGEHGIVLYPIFLTSSIGYGYRFGISYLFLALTLSAAGFTIAQSYNMYLANNPNLLIAFYLGIVVVPLYAANLLKRHRQILERMQIVDSARSRFIANMSHELRTPLHAIISVSDILSAEKYSSPVASDDYTNKLHLIRDSGHHLLKLVNRILDAASVDAAGVRGGNRSAISLDNTVLSALRICQPTAESKGLEFYWYFDLSLPQYIESSAEFLEEIIINTVGNAAKYTNDGHIFTRMTKIVNKDVAYLSIEINDTGIGIHPKLLPTIFEPFTLGDDRASRRYSGTGLGLTLTKQFVEHLGGTILIESTLGVGTICKILLPILSVDSGRPVSFGSQLKVLNGLFISTIEESDGRRRLFEKAGWNCRTITDISSIIELHCVSLDAIFVDASIGTQWPKVIHAARKRFPRTPIYAYGDVLPMSSEDMRINSSLPIESQSALRRARVLSIAATMREIDGDEYQRDIPSNTRRILVADDNAINLKAARFALESRGHEITLVSSGDGALAALENGAYDLAVIDLHMPDMSGIEVSQIYQYLFVEHRTPIIILTADATSEAEFEAKRAGAIAVLKKPLHVSQFLAAVDEYAMGRARPSDTQLNKTDTDYFNLDAEYLIDVSILSEFIDLGVGRDDLKDMLFVFETETQNLINELMHAYNEERGTDVRGAFHSIQGACGTMGAVALKRHVIRFSCVIDEIANDSVEKMANQSEMLLRASVRKMEEVIETSTRGP